MRNLFLTNRFFYLMGGLIGLFWLAFPLGFLFPVAQFALLLAVAVVIADVFRLFSKGVDLSGKRNCQAVFSLSDPNPVHLNLHNSSNLALHLTIHDELPVHLQIRDFEKKCTLAPGQTEQIDYELRPLSRGVYAFGNIVVYASTNWGLVERRFRLGQPQEVAVYPSIIQMKRYEMKALRQIAHGTGIKKIRRIGHSYEFEQIKNYNEGDDFRSINWKASSRRGNLMVNQYEDERSQYVWCIIDKSRSMRMPFEGLSLMDYAINTTLAVSNIILKKNDKVGLLSFSDVIGATLNADGTPAQRHRIMEALYREKERPVEANFELLFQAVRRLINVRSLLLLYTNFESMYALERALPHLRRLARSHLLVVVFFENTEIRDVAHKEADTIADIYKQTIAQQFLQDKKEMVHRLRQFGIQAVLTKPENLTLNTINKYLELKSRGLI